jgi:large subunit ribosomal protein L24
MKIKTGDNVVVLSGSDKGKTGKVLQVIQSTKKERIFVVVEGLNKIKRHLKSRKAGEKGQIIELDGPIDISNVQLIDPKTKKPTRVGFSVDGNTKKRVAKKSGEFID